MDIPESPSPIEDSKKRKRRKRKGSSQGESIVDDASGCVFDGCYFASWVCPGTLMAAAGAMVAFTWILTEAVSILVMVALALMAVPLAMAAQWSLCFHFRH